MLCIDHIFVFVARLYVIYGVMVCDFCIVSYGAMLVSVFVVVTWHVSYFVMILCHNIIVCVCVYHVLMHTSSVCCLSV